MMRSNAVMNITGARALALLKGATLWRAYVNSPDNKPYSQQRAHGRYRAWADRFIVRERTTERELGDAMQRICATAYTEAMSISAHSRDN